MTSLQGAPNDGSEEMKKTVFVVVGAFAVIATFSGVHISMLIWSHSVRNSYDRTVQSKVESLRVDFRRLDDRLRHIEKRNAMPAIDLPDISKCDTLKP